MEGANLRFDRCAKERRKRKNITQQEMAKELNVTLKTYQNWENQTATPAIGDIYKICELLDCDVDFLFGRQSLPRKICADIHDETGLSEMTILNLHDIANMEKPITEAIYDFLDALTDSVFFPLLAIRYKQYTNASFSSDNYSIVDNAGNHLDIVDGDIATILMQNAFNRFLTSPKEFSRAYLRKQRQTLTEAEIEDLHLSDIIDISRGK